MKGKKSCTRKRTLSPSEMHADLRAPGLCDSHKLPLHCCTQSTHTTCTQKKKADTQLTGSQTLRADLIKVASRKPFQNLAKEVPFTDTECLLFLVFLVQLNKFYVGFTLCGKTRYLLTSPKGNGK